MDAYFHFIGIFLITIRYLIRTPKKINMQIQITTQQQTSPPRKEGEYVEVSPWVTQALDDRPNTPEKTDEPKRMVQFQLSPALMLHTLKMKKP